MPFDRSYFTALNAYKGALGAGVLLSVGHYLTHVSALSRDVPIHFNISGHADSFVNKKYFIIYPMLTLLFATVGVAQAEGGGARLARAEVLPTAVTLSTSLVALGVTQVYAAKIAKGEATELPLGWRAVIGGALGSAILYSLANAYLNR